mgnify:FL=1
MDRVTAGQAAVVPGMHDWSVPHLIGIRATVVNDIRIGKNWLLRLEAFRRAKPIQITR